MPPDPPQPARNSEEQVLARLFQSKAVRPIDQLRIPQFGIMHMLVWMTLTAVLLKIGLALSPDAPFGKTPETHLLIGRTWMAICAIMMASGLVGALCACASKVLHDADQTSARPLARSHSCVGKHSQPDGLADDAGRVGQRSQERLVRAVIMAFLTSFFAVAFGFATSRLRDARRWTNLFQALAVFHGISAAMAIAAIAIGGLLPGHGHSSPEMVLLGMTQCSWPLLLPWSIIVAVLDWRRRALRDWVHWLGAVLLCLGYGVGIAFGLVAAMLHII